MVLDPARMAQGIMTGIGFVGAGAVFYANFMVRFRRGDARVIEFRISPTGE